MGTRADFYIGRGADAEWLGSIAWDGYPPGITPHGEKTVRRYNEMVHVDEEWPAGAHLFDATNEADFRARVERFFQYRKDVTRPAEGWPWPWEDSCTTDYAYAFDGGTVWASCFGHAWFDPRVVQDGDNGDMPGEKCAVFPQFSKERMAPVGSDKSGVMVIGY